MNLNQFYISTIAADGAEIAQTYGLGLEIAEYCTASNMDEGFAQTDSSVQQEIQGVSKLLFHAPFNELFPCAIDPKARALAAERYRQAIGLAKSYGATKVIIHGGYNPRIYYPVWYKEQSILFWKDFLKNDPGVEIVLENVLEEEPGLLLDIVAGVNDPRLRLCMDVGHVNAYSAISVLEWVESSAPFISHFHIHNNNGSWDTHSPLFEGTIPMKELIQSIDALCPEVTVTLELIEAERSVVWLKENVWSNL